VTLDCTGVFGLARPRAPRELGELVTISVGVVLIVIERLRVDEDGGVVGGAGVW